MKLGIGNLLICLMAFIHFVRSANNIMTTVAGTGVQSFSGDNGQATAATTNGPTGCAFDSSGTKCRTLLIILNWFFIHYYFNIGNVYFADNDNYRIRKVTVSTGIIKTIAGKGVASPSFSGDNGQATSAALSSPYGLALDTSGICKITTFFHYFFTIDL
jgi:hypothetical protein